MQKTLVIFDLMPIFFAGFHTGRNLSYNQQPTGLIFRSLRSLFKILGKFQPTHYLLAMDSPPYLRAKIQSAYKGNRQPVSSEFLSQRDSLMRFFELGTSSVLSQANFEADDVIAYATQLLEPEFDSIIILTNDNDLYQLITARVSVAFLDLKLMNYGRFLETYGVEPSEWPLVKAIIGDKTDNIPGVPGVQLTTALKYLSGTASAAKTELISQFRDQIQENLTIIKLPYAGCFVRPQFEYFFYEELLQSFFQAYGFASLQKDVEKYVRLLNCVSPT